MLGDVRVETKYKTDIEGPFETYHSLRLKGLRRVYLERQKKLNAKLQFEVSHALVPHLETASGHRTRAFAFLRSSFISKHYPELSSAPCLDLQAVEEAVASRCLLGRRLPSTLGLMMTKIYRTPLRSVYITT
jgi:hypothetical protein